MSEAKGEVGGESGDYAPGTRVGGYEVVRVLGAGGFSRTYEATHALLGERACLKVGLRPEDDALLLREGRILWSLAHRSLPALRDAVRGPDGRLALAMRFVDGPSLDRLRPLAPDRAVALLRDLLPALEALHARGIVHGDVKPTNVLVEAGGKGRAVLVDLGLAVLRPTEDTRALGHTPGFCAPEVLAGGPPIPESDLYALGLTFLYALGADLERKVLPAAAPRRLLEMLTSWTRPDPARRPRWGGPTDPHRQIAALAT